MLPPDFKMPLDSKVSEDLGDRTMFRHLAAGNTPGDIDSVNR